MLEKCKKKKKGQVGFGAILMAFIGILVGVALFLTVAQQIGSSTSTIAIVNQSTGAAAANSTVQYLTNFRSISDVVVYNTSNSILLTSGNYTITNNVVYNGQEVVSITPLSVPLIYAHKWNISGTAEPQGYIGGAGRSVALLIPIFFALLIAVIALEPTMRNGVLDLIGR